jgi:hypothetical protein
MQLCRIKEKNDHGESAHLLIQWFLCTSYKGTQTAIIALTIAQKFCNTLVSTDNRINDT